MTRSTRHERPDGFERLPSRFQRYVDSLESVVASLRERLPSVGVTRVKVTDRLHVSHDLDTAYLPDETIIEYNAARPLDAQARVVFEVKLVGDALEVRSSHGGRLVVLPDVSNVVRLKITDKW